MSIANLTQRGTVKNIRNPARIQDVQIVVSCIGVSARNTMAEEKYWCGECNNCSIRDEYNVECFYQIHDDWPRGEWTKDTVLPESLIAYIGMFNWGEQYLADAETETQPSLDAGGGAPRSPDKIDAPNDAKVRPDATVPAARRSARLNR
jgi:hypothetical protein